MSVINTNITALIGQQNLGRSQSALQTSMERLSSGLRINSAKDDAAGQAIANRMSAQITGLSQAQRNANDGISVAQTAEGALNQVNDNLQRIRELTVQAQNGTNSGSDLNSIQDEINQRLEEINRISKETDFNGVKVLASDQELSIQVGANDGEKITLNLKEINSDKLGLEGFSVKQTSLNVSEPITQLGDGSGALTDVDLSTFATTLESSLGLSAGDIDVSSLKLRNIQDSSGSTGNYVVEYNGEYYEADMGTPTAPDLTTVTDTGSGGETYAVKISQDSEGTVSAYVTSEGKNYEAGSLGAVAVDLETAAEFSGAATNDPLASLDTALSTVDSLRSELGAMQNRFESAITNLGTTETNLSAARSRIEDADYAVEVSNMTRAQILQQAGTSVLAQANQVPQSVLSLLG